MQRRRKYSHSHFVNRAPVVKCMGSELSWIRSVWFPNSTPRKRTAAYNNSAKALF